MASREKFAALADFHSKVVQRGRLGYGAHEDHLHLFYHEIPHDL